ncbi:MAG: magnesium transporter CorA [Clostridiales bacterium]|nr:magnesium transporter CorA [Clostridiales bacterium]
MYYLLNSSMKVLDNTYDKKDGDILVSLVTTEECRQFHRELPFFPVLEKNMKNHNITYCKADLLKDCVIGTLLIPDKEFLQESSLSIVFYLKKDLLVLVDDVRHIDAIIGILREGELLDSRNIGEFFCRLLGYLTNEDSLFLQNLERKMSDLEEQLPRLDAKKIQGLLIHTRKDLLILHSYYQQLLYLCESLEENSNHFFTEEECQSFSLYASRIERLYRHAQMLREYALQIREMYQTAADIRQNHTMRILTVVTTIFLPLSLLTGWYGMNFRYMPELDSPYGYFTLIGICILIIAIEIWIFYKNKWLS